MHEDLCFASATELTARIRRGELSPVDLVEACLDRIDAHDDPINAFRIRFDDRARERARAAANAIESAEVWGPLHGLPVAIKDNADVAGESTAGGMKPLLSRPVERDSVSVKRLRDAGAIFLGKTHVPELGFGTTDTSWGEPTSTPFDVTRNSGGSSGGSAAAVAAGFVPIALGTDGGGSVRIPSSWSGTFAIKPTFRRVPRLNRRPSDAFVSTTPFSEFGPITRTVEDAALMLDVMAGPHPRDPFSHPDDDPDYVGAPGRSVDGLRIAYSPDLDTYPVDDRVADIVGAAARTFEEAGATVEEAAIGHGYDHTELTDTWMGWVDVSRAKGAERMAESGIDLLGEHRDEIHPVYVECVERGREVGAVEHGRTTEIRTDLLNAFQDLFGEYDLVAAPTLAVPPVENADEGYTTGPDEVDGEPVDPHIGWCLTPPLNFTGQPAANVPAGFTDDGLPVGMQLIGPRLAEDRVLAACAAFERLNPWADRYPSLL